MPLKIYTDTEIASGMRTFSSYIVLASSSHRQLLSAKSKLNPIQSLEKTVDQYQLKKYGDSKTSFKSKSPRSGKGGNSKDGNDS